MRVYARVARVGRNLYPVPRPSSGGGTWYSLRTHDDLNQRWDTYTFRYRVDLVQVRMGGLQVGRACMHHSSSWCSV